MRQVQHRACNHRDDRQDQRHVHTGPKLQFLHILGPTQKAGDQGRHKAHLQRIGEEAEKRAQHGQDHRADPHLPRGFVWFNRHLSARFHPKGAQRHHTGHGKHQGVRGQHGDDNEPRLRRDAEGACVFQLFPDEAQEWREACHGHRGKGCGEGGKRHDATQTAEDLRLPCASGVVDAAHHQEQRGFVKRMHDQEGGEGGHSITALLPQKERERAKRHQRRIGQRLFQVGLAQGEDAGRHGSDRPKDGQRPHPDIGAGHARMQPRHQIDTRLHHRGRMQEGRHRRGRGHGVGEPEMERKLRGFGESTREDQNEDRHVKRVGFQFIGTGQDLRHLETAHAHPQQDETGKQRQGARAGHKERLQGGAAALGRLVPEADQQVGGDRRQLPKDKKADQVVRQNQPQHRQHEAEQKQRKAVKLRMARQISVGIKKHQGADAGDQQRESQRQAIDEKRERNAQRRHPLDHIAQAFTRPDGLREGQEPRKQRGGYDRGQEPNQAVAFWVISGDSSAHDAGSL